ncbi:MAG: Acetolactate synthase large subunit IlvG [Alphaproteobacteria bacterium MarineAlpha9_Bin4]|nr:acetolactate synthase [Pelagibacterales bacterium]PPR26541.1 MAG: Acetolactate synthase large subunit IlvG [Alphaproteobacteria bacterium MarineAlpha9_Bin4]|tara:strand:- start:1274 stop:2995 length:1722 start_codon:yes stop_codon:yes gene_type:complete
MSRDLNIDNNSVASWIVKFLVKRKVKIIFGLQGGHIQPIWDFCFKLGIRIIDVRDEKAAIHMAQAYSMLTNKIGVAMVTAGPGVTNTVTGIANASLSYTPIILIGGCTTIPQSNRGPLQDIPHVEILRPITRYSRTARVPEQVIRELDLAFSHSIGHLGEPGPSYIEIPTDVLRSKVEDKLVLSDWIKEKNPYQIWPSENSIDLFVSKFSSSKRPLVISGRGAKNCSNVLNDFLSKTSVLYLDTQDSRGLISSKHQSNVFAARSKVMSEADLVILVGRKLDYQLAYGSPAIFNKAKFIRISDNPQELVDNRRGDPEIYADPEIVFRIINKRNLNTNFDKKWIENIKTYHLKKIKKSKNIEHSLIGDDSKINPTYIFTCIKRLLSDDFVGIADGGDILSFARVWLDSKYYLDSGVFGCLGVGIPYAIVAAEIHKDIPTICIIGDGSFGFNAMELDTAVRNNSNICVIISNNAAWNIETQDQKLNYGNRVYGTTLRHSDYAKMAQGLGAFGIRVEKPEDLEHSIHKALKNTPSVVDVITSSTMISSDAIKGLGLVPKYQALDIWDDLEKKFREEN